MAKKPWDYEDDHDWSDDVDYAAEGKVYWYGKYYKKEDIDALFPVEREVDPRRLATLLGAATMIGGGVWAIRKYGPGVADWWRGTAWPGITRPFRRDDGSEAP